MQNIVALDNTRNAKKKKKKKQSESNSALQCPVLQSFNILSLKLITTVLLAILQNFELTNKHAGQTLLHVMFTLLNFGVCCN